MTCFRDGRVTLRKNRRTTGFTESIKEIGYQGIRKGDLVIHAMDAFAGAVGVSDSDGKATPVYAACQPAEGVNAEYYARVVREMAHSQYVAALSTGIRQRSTDFRYATFAAEFVPVPPPEKQREIARYLVGAEVKVNRLIRAKQRLIALLTEQKQAVIQRAVTRGLNPDVPLKPSGVDWLGDVPEHWELRRAKAVCERIVDCKNRTPEVHDSGDYVVVRTSNVRDGKLDLTDATRTDETNYIEWTQRGAPRSGDVFFTREAPAGEACLVPDMANLCMGQRMMYLRPRSGDMLPGFLLANIMGPLVQRYIEVETNGSTVGHLRLGQVGALPVLWAPLDEQAAIVNYIDEEVAVIDEAIGLARHEIALIREYRQRLVADVVTGKLDVRGVEVPDAEAGDFGDDVETEETDDLALGDEQETLNIL